MPNFFTQVFFYGVAEERERQKNTPLPQPCGTAGGLIKVIKMTSIEDDRHRRDPLHRIGPDLSAEWEACTQWDVGKEGWRGAPIAKMVFLTQRMAIMSAHCSVVLADM